MELYRGMKNFEGNEKIITTRKDRKPLHLSMDIHEQADLIFEDKFGIKFRSQSVFCTGSYKEANSYGNIVVRVEPIGHFTVCWSPLCDDFIKIMDKNDMSVQEFIEINKYQTGDINLAIASKNEIMLYCKQYRAIKIL